MARTPITISLDDPVNAYGEQVATLVINSPKGADILECGYPFATERNPRTGAMSDTINVPAMRQLLSKMAQVPESTIDQLCAVDLYRAIEAVKFFFWFKVQKSSSSTSSASDDGQATKDSSSS
jgi:hypothetical protein